MTRFTSPGSPKPGLADRAQAAPLVRAAFNPVMRAAFGVLGIKQVLLPWLRLRRVMMDRNRAENHATRSPRIPLG